MKVKSFRLKKLRHLLSVLSKCFSLKRQRNMSSESSTFKHLIDPSWREQLSNDISAPYFANLEQFVNQARKEHVGEIFPFADKVFSWSKLCTFDKVKVVIIGQDPYPGKKNGVPLANGLAFSVSRETGKVPLSLGNIFKELRREYPSFAVPVEGDLSGWAKQGVLLINTVLTVQEGKPDSHKGKGWEQFTDAAIKAVNEKRDHVVYLLWGSAAKEKASHVDKNKNLVLETSHPSPQSVHKGFDGCDHFKKANEYLTEHGKETIVWNCFS